MKREELLILVKEEADNLIASCSEEEKYKLQEAVDANDIHSCIYGQLTGYCYSKRAAELMKGLPVSFCSLPYELVDQDDLLEVVNIAPRLGTELHTHRYSPIEVYIGLIDADVDALVNYIRGRTTTLNIK